MIELKEYLSMANENYDRRRTRKGYRLRPRPLSETERQIMKMTREELIERLSDPWRPAPTFQTDLRLKTTKRMR